MMYPVDMTASDSGIFKGLLGQLIEKQQSPFVYSLGSDLDYLWFKGRHHNFTMIFQPNFF